MARPRHTRLAADRARRLRRRLTASEARVWGGLKGGACGARFRRQVPIGRWIVDFATFEPRLVVEIDDTSHDFRDESVRTADLEAFGFVILRFTNREVAADIHSVLGTIAHWVTALRDCGGIPTE